MATYCTYIAQMKFFQISKGNLILERLMMPGNWKVVSVHILLHTLLAIHRLVNVHAPGKMQKNRVHTGSELSADSKHTSCGSHNQGTKQFLFNAMLDKLC